MTDRSNASVISLLVLPFPGNPEQRAVKRVYVCVYLRVTGNSYSKYVMVTAWMLV